MVNKIVGSVGRYAAKKIGSKSLQKMNDTYDKFQTAVFGAKPLNVGEKETI